MQTARLHLHRMKRPVNMDIPQTGRLLYIGENLEGDRIRTKFLNGFDHGFVILDRHIIGHAIP
jgi:hypothetical protein